MADAHEVRFEGRRILVVEDEYVIAMEIADVLGDFGAEIVGPVGSVDQALKLIACERPLDAALLDVNLSGERVFPVADALAVRGVPFLFSTGYDATVLGDYQASVRVEKPADPVKIASELKRLIDNVESTARRAPSVS